MTEVTSNLHGGGLNILLYAIHNLSLFMHHRCKILGTKDPSQY